MRSTPGTVDYTTLKRKGDKRPSNDTRGALTVPRQWWRLKGKECARSIAETVSFLQRIQMARIKQQVISARLYGNISLSGSSGSAYVRLLHAQTATRDRATYNAIQSIIDTLTSRIGENKPRPYYLPSGGDWKQHRKAKKLNLFTEGVFYETKTYDTGVKVFRDSAIWGDGFMHVFVRGKKVVHERVAGSELWVDEVEAQYGEPRNMHRLKSVDRDEACFYFPKFADLIRRASRSAETESRSIPNVSDMVTIIESWHVGTPDEDGEVVDGRHVFTLPAEGALISSEDEEDWPFDFFPFAKMPWCERPYGYWSQGCAEQLQGEQLELNNELWLIQRSFHMAGTVKCLLPNGSTISEEKINNEVGAIINYAPPHKPEFFVAQPIHPDYFENTQRILERMYRKSGVSEMSSSGHKPAGLNSGRALRESQDIESRAWRRHKKTC